MMLKIRLARVGAKHSPRYRVVVAESATPRDGTYVERLGHYNPTTDPADVAINAERARLWLERGAQPTETVASLLRRQGIL